VSPVISAALLCGDKVCNTSFLETQEPVDRERIGVAGLSGGGTTGLFLTALEPRIALAMIGGYFCTFRDSIFSIHHCICSLQRKMSTSSIPVPSASGTCCFPASM